MPGPTEPLGRTTPQGAAGQSGGTISAGNRILFSVESRAPNGAWNIVIRSATANAPISMAVLLKNGSDPGGGRSGAGFAVGSDLTDQTMVGRLIAGGRVPTIEVLPQLGEPDSQSLWDGRSLDAAIRILSAGGLPVTDALVSLLRSARRSGRIDERTLWLLGVFRDKGFGPTARDLEGFPGFIPGRDANDSAEDQSRGGSNRRRREKNVRRAELLRNARAAIRRAVDVPKNTLQFFNHARGTGYHWIIVPFALETDSGRIEATLTAALLPHRKKIAGARLSVTYNDDEYSFAWKPPPAGELELSFASRANFPNTGDSLGPGPTAAALKRIFGPRGFTRVSVRPFNADDGFSIPGVRGIIPRIDESV